MARGVFCYVCRKLRLGGTIGQRGEPEGARPASDEIMRVLRRKTHHVFGSRTLSFLFSFVLMIFQRLDYKMHIRINSYLVDVIADGG